ncbi:MAG: bifunctional folylpolyglutamate synthase/dihydrofolate synthase [Candidatus Limnocylindrales bacterium]
MPPRQADYAATLATLQARGRFGIRLGLGRTRALLRALGEPGRDMPGVLIAGTNGKGSVQAMVAACLAAAGLRVGQTPKPHLVSYRERILIDGRPLTETAFASLLAEVLEVADGLTNRLGPPTEFEVLTAAAFAAFTRSGVDIGVVEVGLGGRLDATNAWDGGVAAVTNVGLDHMDRLGPTVEAIAREKAAIIKRGDRAVSGADGVALAVVRRRARRLGVPLRIVQPLAVAGMERGGLRIVAPGLGEVRLGLLGRHQAANAAVALGILAALAEAGIAAPTAAQVRTGLQLARWPGRLELLALGADGLATPARTDAPDPAAPDLLLDGAHNADGAAALAAALDELRPSLSPGRATLLFAAMRDKDVAAMAANLGGSAALQGARIIPTHLDMSRALPALRLGRAWRAGSPDGGQEVTPLGSIDDALGTAVAAARASGGPLIVAGSLYLVGAVRGRLVADDLTPDPGAG